MNFIDTHKWILLAVLALVTALSGFWTNAYVSKLAYSHPQTKTVLVDRVVTKTLTNTRIVDHWIVRPDGSQEHTREATDNTILATDTAHELAKSSIPTLLAGQNTPEWALLGAWAAWEGTIMAGAGRNMGNLTIGASTPLPVTASLAGFSPRPWKWQDSQVNLIFRF